jgi:hypothetical protein
VTTVDLHPVGRFDQKLAAQRLISLTEQLAIGPFLGGAANDTQPPTHQAEQTSPPGLTTEPPYIKFNLSLRPLSDDLVV